MLRNLVLAALAAVALAACDQRGGAAKKGGPAVAQGDGVTITSDEFKARLDEQSPFIRARFATLDKKKEFLDNLVRFEVLANEAKKQGLDQDPDVQLMAKRMMVQKLVQKRFAGKDEEAAKSVPDAEVEAYYASHQDEFHRPAKVRVAQLVVRAPASGPERAKKEAEAKKLLARARAEEQKAPGAGFTAVVREASQDDASKAMGGDLNFRTKDELAALVSREVADAAFALKDGQVSDVLPAPAGFVVVKRTGGQEGFDRSMADAKPQIAAKLAKDRRAKDFEEYVKRLKDEAKVKVNDAELEKIAVSGAAPGAPGAAMGMPLRVPQQGAPAPAPAPARAP